MVFAVLYCVVAVGAAGASPLLPIRSPDAAAALPHSGSAGLGFEGSWCGNGRSAGFVVTGAWANHAGRVKLRAYPGKTAEDGDVVPLIG
jgi:hypothetical protein